MCAATRRTLEIKDVPYEYVDVNVNRASAGFLRSLEIHQLPVVVDGPGLWTGFRPDLIVEASRRLSAKRAAH